MTNPPGTTNLAYRQEKPLSLKGVNRGARLPPERRRLAKIAFLKAYAKNGIISEGIRAAGVSRPTYLTWLERDKKFAALCEVAYAKSVDSFRSEIVRRGRDGVLKRKVVLEDGKPVKQEMVREYSDTLLIFHAKSLMPEYREKSNIDASGTIRVEVVHVPLPGTSVEGATVDGEYRALSPGQT